MTETQKKYQKTVNGRYNSYKGSAKVRGLEFSLTKEHFVDAWGDACSYCGDTIKTVGFDRIDSSKGYTPENVVSCCFTCNRMKTNLTRKEFLLRVKLISENLEL